MRLLCDEMLRGLGRWLRAAGNDTRIASGEGRTLLTRDHHLARTAPPGVEVVLLGNDTLDTHARVLRERLGLDWHFAPFTRCLVDNAPLRPANAEEAARLPESARAMGGPIRACPVCERLYWPGSHVRRMTARLDAWAA